MSLTASLSAKLPVSFSAKCISAFFFILCLVGIVPSQAAAQVNISASVNRNQVRPGEVFYLTLAINTGDANVNIDEPRIPDLRNFEILNVQQGSEMRSVFSNGKFQVQRSQNYQYTLTALQPGQYTIPPIEVGVGGQIFRSQPVVVTVSESAPSGRGGGGGGADEEEPDPFQEMDEMFSQLLRRQLGKRPGAGGTRGGPVDLKDAFYIQVEVDKTTAYVGEQITVSWYLVTRAQIADIDTLKYPAVEGFWREDIELATRLNFRPEIINGISYDRALLASFALFPHKAGPAKIDEYTAKCTVYAINALGGGGQQVQVKSSQVVPITVLPLPTEGKPADFTGAVGEFKVNAQVENTAATVGSPISYKIRFDGRGNAKLIDLPKIPFPAAIQSYDPKSSTKFFPDGRSFKEYEIILVPRQAGEVKIPAVTMSFFDPRTKKYYTEKTNEIVLNVAPGTGTQTIAGSPLQNSTSVEPEKIVKPTLPGLILQMEDSGEFTLAQRMAGWTVFAFAGFVFLGWRYFVEFGTGKKREGLRKRLKDKFSQVEKKMAAGDTRGAAIEMTNTIYFVLGELSGLGGASREMAVLLEKAPPSFRREVAEPLQKLMQQVEILGFAPDAVVAQMKSQNKGDLRQYMSELKALLNRSLEYEFEEETKT